MTGEGLFISTLNYQKHDRKQISNTIPSGCKADLKLCHQSCAVLKEKTSALLAKNTNTMRGELGLRAIISLLTSACCSLLKDVMADRPSKIDTAMVIYCGP